MNQKRKQRKPKALLFENLLLEKTEVERMKGVTYVFKLQNQSALL